MRWVIQLWLMGIYQELFYTLNLQQSWWHRQPAIMSEAVLLRRPDLLELAIGDTLPVPFLGMNLQIVTPRQWRRMKDSNSTTLFCCQLAQHCHILQRWSWLIPFHPWSGHFIPVCWTVSHWQIWQKIWSFGIATVFTFVLRNENSLRSKNLSTLRAFFQLPGYNFTFLSKVWNWRDWRSDPPSYVSILSLGYFF